MMIGYDIYFRFTMEHFPLCQSLILTTIFFLLATVPTCLKILLKPNRQQHCMSILVIENTITI
jgi:multisubunit Na+/H+ antiporter MnhC subunit